MKKAEMPDYIRTNNFWVEFSKEFPIHPYLVSEISDFKMDSLLRMLGTITISCLDGYDIHSFRDAIKKYREVVKLHRHETKIRITIYAMDKIGKLSNGIEYTGKIENIIMGSLKYSEDKLLIHTIEFVPYEFRFLSIEEYKNK